MAFDVSFLASSSTFDTSSPQTNTFTGDYRAMFNKPSINNVILNGALTLRELSLVPVYYDTTANWDLQRDMISERGAIYIYSDYWSGEVDGTTQFIPAIRIGDGTSYLIDLPFTVANEAAALAEALSNHIRDTTVHVTQAQKDFWNSKYSAYVDDDESLIFSKTYYDKGE